MSGATDGRGIRNNVFANLVGRIWGVLVPIVLVPVYIRFLGIEAYGLIGVFATLQALSALLDMGLAVTLTRETAHLAARPENGAVRDLVRTLEVVYWSAALVITVAVAAMAPLIAGHWVHATTLSPHTVRMAITVMGFSIAVQFPLALYYGGLNGIERQVAVNAIAVAYASVRGIGAVLVLLFVSRSVLAFFICQAVLAPTATVAAAWMLWRCLPASRSRARFRLDQLRRIWRFSLSISGISVAAAVLTQLDKVILSRLLTLEYFGYYVLAGSIALGLYTVANPIFTAVFPRLSQLVASADEHAVSRMYHRSCQFMSVALLPIATVLAAFSWSVVNLWTRDPIIADRTRLVLGILTPALALNGLVQIPYALQLAHGWTRLALSQNAIALVVLVPSMLWATSVYGPAGAAACWLALNVGYVAVGLPFMHRRLLRGHAGAWFGEDVGLPLLATLSVCIPARLLLGDHFGGGWAILVLGSVVAAAMLVAALATPAPRSWMRERTALAITALLAGRRSRPADSSVGA